MDQQEAPSTVLSTRQEFSGTSMVLANTETSSTAVAAQAQAAIQARYIMALRKPRSWDDVRVRLVGECRRPGFAAVARYRKPIGKGVEGLSIRFVEAALRCMTNVLPEVMAIYDDVSKKIVRVTVTDLENNITYSQDITISKTVERSKPMDDGSYISVRKNSWGKDVFTVPGTDDDLLNKEGALISKAMRTLGLRLIPGDIQDECEALIIKTAADKAAKDPDGERKALTDAFATLGVTPRQLESYLGQPLNQLTPHQLVELRGLYAALRDGEATWKSVMDNKAAQEGGAESGARTTTDEQTGVQTNAAGVKQPRTKSERNKDKGSGEPTPPPSSPPPPPPPNDFATSTAGPAGQADGPEEDPAELGADLLAAETELEVHTLSQRIQYVRDPDEAAQLTNLVGRKLAAFKKPAAAAAAQAQTVNVKLASEGYIKMVLQQAKNGEITEAEIFKKFGMKTWDGCTFDKANEILAWVHDPK